MSTPGFGLHFRRYAPFEKFGIPSFKGDGRGASTSLQATSRTYGCVLFNQFGILNRFGGSSGTEDANLVLHFLERKAMSAVSISAERSNDAGPALLVFTASTAGSNPLIPASPDIDTKVVVRVDWGSGQAMRVSGTVAGDDFPNLEVFIRCYRSGRSALIVDGRTDRNRYTGPFTLYGAWKQLCSFSASIPLSNQGIFISDQTCAPCKI